MKRPLHLLLALVLAAAIGGLSVYGLLYMPTAPTSRPWTPPIMLAPTRFIPVPIRSTVSHAQDARSAVTGAGTGTHAPIDITTNGKRATADVQPAPLIQQATQ